MRPALFGKIARFAGVGALATLAYAGLATAFVRFGGMPSVAAAITAYLCCAALSYALHRRVTFRSDRAHAAALPRFAATTAAGLALATLLAAAGAALGLPAEAAFVATSIAVPLLNFALLDRLVFPERTLPGTVRHEH